MDWIEVVEEEEEEEGLFISVYIGHTNIIHSDIVV